MPDPAKEINGKICIYSLENRCITTPNSIIHVCTQNFSSEYNRQISNTSSPYHPWVTKLCTINIKPSVPRSKIQLN